MKAKLRVGVLVGSLSLEAWKRDAIERIVASESSQLVLVVTRAKRKMAVGRAQKALDALQRVLDERLEGAPDAFETGDARDLLAQMPLVELGESRPMQDGVSAIATHRLDVLVQLDDAPLAAELAPATRSGVWALVHGDERKGFGNPAGFWEVYQNEPVTGCSVQALLAGDRRARVLSRSFSATNAISVKLGNDASYWKNAALVPRKLAQLHAMGIDAFFARFGQEHAAPVPLRRAPTAAQTLLHIARTLRRRLGNMASRVLTAQPWILLYHRGGNLPNDPNDLRELREVIAPKDRYWADPFVVVRDGGCYFFVEEFMNATGKGHLSVLELQPDGRCGPPQTVLDRSYHLSYPFVFEHEGDLLMVPESSADFTVQLYRCVEFPLKWAFVSNLLEGVRAVDSTLLYHEGKWWLFTSLRASPHASSSEELSLFYSNALTGAPWTPHPLNPVVSDVRGARPAGALFRRNGELYRPAQDCSVRYGYAVRIKRITALSETEYGETDAGSIEPTWDRRILATHTLNSAADVTVIDAVKMRLRA